MDQSLAEGKNLDESSVGKFIKGVATVDTGINKNWEPKSTFQRGMELHAKQIVIAEGARGSLAERVIKDFNLRRNSDVHLRHRPQGGVGGARRPVGAWPR